jgi:hypothetical protein
MITRSNHMSILNSLVDMCIRSTLQYKTDGSPAVRQEIVQHTRDAQRLKWKSTIFIGEKHSAKIHSAVCAIITILIACSIATAGAMESSHSTDLRLDNIQLIG